MDPGFVVACVKRLNCLTWHSLPYEKNNSDWDSKSLAYSRSIFGPGGRSTAFKLKELVNRAVSLLIKARVFGEGLCLWDSGLEAGRGARWRRTGKPRGRAGRRQTRGYRAWWGRSGRRAAGGGRRGGGAGHGVVVRGRRRGRVDGSARRGLGCCWLVLHPCEVDATTLKQRKDTFDFKMYK